MDKIKKFLVTNKVKRILIAYFPILVAFGCMLYSVGLGVSGNTAEAQYTAHWPGTILLFYVGIKLTRI